MFTVCEKASPRRLDLGFVVRREEKSLVVLRRKAREMDLMMNGQPLDLSGNGFASPFVFVELGQTYSYLLPHSRFPVMKSNRLWIANLLPGPRYASLR